MQTQQQIDWRSIQDQGQVQRNYLRTWAAVIMMQPAAYMWVIIAQQPISVVLLLLEKTHR